MAFHFAKKRKGRARERWKRKGECESAPLPSVSCAYSSVGASQFPSARILFAQVASTAEASEKTAWEPCEPEPFFSSCIIGSLFGCFRAFESSGDLAAREVRRLGCRERGQEGYA